MRLVDADELKEIIQGSEELLDLQKEECIACIDACDTAFDVDVVVEKLKKQSSDYRAREKEYKKYPTKYEESTYFCGKADAFGIAIKIVKAGEQYET